MLILITITGKLILIQFPINWLTMKVTDFVIDFRRSRYMEMAANATQQTSEFQSYLHSASTESPDCIQFWQANKL